MDGAHSGVAPQRDFALLTPIGADADPAAKPSVRRLGQNERQGFRHAASRRFVAGNAAHRRDRPSVVKEGEHDWTLTVKVGDLTFSVIVVGKAEG